MCQMRPVWLTLVLVLLGCQDAKTNSSSTHSDTAEPQEEDTGTGLDLPAPWEVEQTTPLNTHRQMMSITIPHDVVATRVMSLPDRAGAFLFDPEGRQVITLDARYHNDGRSFCINEEHPPSSVTMGASRTCPEGTSPVSRGAIKPPHPPVAMALDATARRLGILTENAMLYRADADPLHAEALNYLALDAGTRITSLPSPVTAAHLAMGGGLLVVAAENQLVIVDTESGEETSQTLPGMASDVFIDGDQIWVATDAGLWVDNALTDQTGQRLVRWQDTLWIIRPEHGEVASISGDSQISVPGLTGPAVTDPLSGKLVLATESGLMRLSPTGDIEDLDEQDVQDLAANVAGEIISLDTNGRVLVHVDETAYPSIDPLQVFVTTFSERPRSPDMDTTPCTADDGDSIASFLSTGLANQVMLGDLPAPTALGLTPQFVRRAQGCDLGDLLRQLTTETWTDVGILLHEQPAECDGDLECHTSFLEGELNALESMSITPLWSSGLSPHHELGIDWVQSLRDAGGPNRFLFFGMSLRHDVPHEGDLRAKDAWPIELDRLSQAWSTDESTSIDERDDRGWLGIFPGDNVPAFNLGSCANLFVNECHPLALGGGTTIDEEDTAVLDVLLHRALAHGETGDVRTWTFHLPDIGTYDYTDGCTRTERTWSGEDCEAARLQTWLLDVHQRLVSTEKVAWIRPAELVVP